MRLNNMTYASRNLFTARVSCNVAVSMAVTVSPYCCSGKKLRNKYQKTNTG